MTPEKVAGKKKEKDQVRFNVICGEMIGQDIEFILSVVGSYWRRGRSLIRLVF